jgi:hypothetical protein
VKVRVIRFVYHGDAHNCAGRDVYKGEEFYLYEGATFGAVDLMNGVPLSEKPGKFSYFFEFPADAIEVFDD